MTAREAILLWLIEHNSFLSTDVVGSSGIRAVIVTQAARKLVKEGVLVVPVRHGSGENIRYHRADNPKFSRALKTVRGVNVIYQECRNSETMKRVLSVYGRGLQKSTPVLAED